MGIQRSVGGFWHLGEQKSKSALAFDSLFAELIIRAESSGVSIEGVRAVFEHNLQSVDSFAVLVQIVSEIHPVGGN